MQQERFDLNDIQHEPTDEQLDALIAPVSTEARQRADAARREESHFLAYSGGNFS